MIVALIFLMIAVWGILTSDAGDHSMQYGMIVGCGLLVVVVLIGDLIRRRRRQRECNNIEQKVRRLPLPRVGRRRSAVIM